MSVTRMLILGAVRIFQPAHGYLVRRELASWQVADWAHLNPGSIYSGLRTLTKDGMLVADEPKGGPTRTQYRLTVDGDQEFVRLVRAGLWELHPFEPGWLMAGVSFWGALPRDEVVAALTARAAQLRARHSAVGFTAAEIPTSAGTPQHIVELMLISGEVISAELAWTEAAIGRIEAGEYGFRGEDPARKMPRVNPMEPPPDAD